VIEGETGRAGYVVFVLNIARMINIHNILGKTRNPVGAGLPAKAVRQAMAMLTELAPSLRCGDPTSQLLRGPWMQRNPGTTEKPTSEMYRQLVRGLRPDTK
jgi:hypothetical protein